MGEKVKERLLGRRKDKHERRWVKTGQEEQMRSKHVRHIYEKMS